ncbi:Altered inheritance of mitochondria 6 protein [Rutstroemia sp. NJR-2017a WRK4]|nr:Altered inheritance of mitochondria 6 protein [Rutstroemia sp. NJR-2017a WRK4]
MIAYTAPSRTNAANLTWLNEFSSDIIPVACHSHNDYMRRVPLYEGLAADCMCTKADIWSRNSSLSAGQADLLVGHTSKALAESRTLRSLYLDPLMNILGHKNEAENALSPRGVFSMAPNNSLVLLLDFKTSDDTPWDSVVAQLGPFRKNDWLTYWSSTAGVVQRPSTVVASGDAPFDTIISNSTYRDIFYDAPIAKLSEPNNPYNSNNSYYASGSLREAVRRTSFGHLSDKQKDMIKSQIETSKALGLKSRYWDTPSWPISFRNRIWTALEELGTDMLNIDDLTAVTRWDWDMCIVGGIAVCD